MNCPKCDVCLGVSLTPDGSPQYRCVKCGWASESVNTLVTASTAYRLAKLKAAGAVPGWYGPDGERCETAKVQWEQDTVLVWNATEFVPVRFARLCGFVEVTE